MKTFVRHAAMLIALAAVCQATFAVAEDFRWISSGTGTAATQQQEDPAYSGNYVYYDNEPRLGVVGQFGFDSFKGASDGFRPSNFGAVTGLNAAMLVPGLSDLGIGWQLGVTYGVYDWDGRFANRIADSQQQTFVTTGFYRKAAEDQRFSGGIVYDWMFNSAWGEYAVNPTFGQWRGQIEYALSDINGIGVYGCLRDRAAVYTVNRAPVLAARSMNQVNLFWHHKFVESDADSWLWFGFPDQQRLSGHGSLGDWIIGASIQVPLSDRLALYGNAQYMHPSAAATPDTASSAETTWNVGAGIAWYFGGHARSDTLSGKRSLPYMPVANNSTFLVDQFPL